MNTALRVNLLALSLALVSFNARAAESLEPSIQAKVDAKMKEAQAWAAEPVLVNAVKARNATPAPELANMTQEQWKNISVLDPSVRALTKNDAAAFLKAKQTGAVAEAFLSGADGVKVAFLAKTTNWSHKGKDKHEMPMSGKTWQGPVETDESTGLRQVQISVPVLDGGKPIGSLVIGLGLSKLEKE